MRIYLNFDGRLKEVETNFKAKLLVYTGNDPVWQAHGAITMPTFRPNVPVLIEEPAATQVLIGYGAIVKEIICDQDVCVSETPENETQPDILVTDETQTDGPLEAEFVLPEGSAEPPADGAAQPKKRGRKPKQLPQHAD